MALTYYRKGDYLFPNLTIQETEAQIGEIRNAAEDISEGVQEQPVPEPCC